VKVSDDAELLPAVKSLLENEAERERLARAALACVERSGGALERTLAALDPYFAKFGRFHDAAARA
jgi:hypothetical protein